MSFFTVRLEHNQLLAVASYFVEEFISIVFMLRQDVLSDHENLIQDANIVTTDGSVADIQSK